MYADVVNHEKLMELPPETFRFWVMTLCVAARNVPRGTLPNIKAIAFRTRSEHVRAQCMIDELIEANLIDRAEDGSLSIHDWDQHQRKSDDSAARMRETRGKNKTSGSKPDKNGTGVPNKFGTCSEHVRARAEQSRTERAEQTPKPPTGATTLPPVPDGPIEPSLCPPYPKPDTDLIDVKTGTHNLTDADAQDVFRRVWNLTGIAKVCLGFYEDQRRHSAATWRAAIAEAAKRGVRVGSVGYLHRIAGDIETGKVKAMPDQLGPTPPPHLPYVDAKKFAAM
jgi:hypothetical protein